jgi:predicted permease
MQTLLQDLKHAVKMFRESPGFTVTVLAALTLGIGANTAIFSVVNAVVLKPVPFDEPDRLVMVVNIDRETGNVAAAASPAKFMHWRAQTDVLEDVAAYRINSLNYSSGDIPERVRVIQASEAYFRALRAPLLRGRTFTPEEDLPDAPKTVVLTHDFWALRLGGDPNAIGRTLILSGDAYSVIGILGQDFDLREFGDPELFVPFQLDPNTTDRGHYFLAVGRLRPGVSLEQAEERVGASMAQYRARFPDEGENAGFTVMTLQAALVGPDARATLWILLGAVALVLLIACANVANLLLVRASGRSREIAIRSAIGAGRGRIVRQLLTESVLLSLIGGVLGLLVGFLGMRALLSVSTAGLPRLGEDGSFLGMDWRVLGFTAALSLITGIVFGLVPALVTSRTDLSAVIKDSSSRSGSGLRQNKTRSALIVVEIGLCVMLLVGTALMIRTSWAISRVDPGFTTTNVLTMRTSLSGPRFLTSTGVEETARLALERIRSIPGVAQATATCCVPLQGGYNLGFTIEGRVNEGPYTGGGGFVTTSTGYFETFEIPIVRGRSFTDLDDADAPPVVVINQALADEHWPDGADPLTDRMHIGGETGMMRELAGEPVRRIIGIAANVRARGLASDPYPIMYVPQAQMPDALNALNVEITPMAWVVRTEVDPSTVSATIQEELRSTTALPVTDLESMEEIVSVSTARQRVHTLLLSVFGGSALVLAAIGIYGLMAYSVQQRTQEIGIRMAMGAEGRTVGAMVVGQALVLIVVGMVVGLVGAYFFANVLASVLFEVEPRDVMVFTTVSVVLTLVALASVTIPATRASRVDPLEALRHE